MSGREDRRPPGGAKRRAHVIVGGTAGAVPGALAGGAVALGAGLPLLPTAVLLLVGAVLGAVAATANRPSRGPAVDGLGPRPATGGAPTPPQGVKSDR